MASSQMGIYVETAHTKCLLSINQFCARVSGAVSDRFYNLTSGGFHTLEVIDSVICLHAIRSFWNIVKYKLIVYVKQHQDQIPEKPLTTLPLPTDGKVVMPI
ncbi:unnamed protein product [Albugo candida]|uniref:Uncharacterized protein n=1 Tax=Albugo candida TaxID=65357 RepID=A0A024G0U0_9STRA|nr:unnamed protein product [Albugo candida]|eukprot:CCI39910.1 unnamed protein product [Albugo candida]